MLPLRFHPPLLMCFAATSAWGATLTGTVTDAGGAPAADCFVTASSEERAMAVTVLTDRRGTFSIDELFPGAYGVRAHTVGADSRAPAEIVLTESGASLELALQANAAPGYDVPGAAWLQQLPEGELKAAFVTGCTICHDMGSPVARAERNAEQWQDMIATMRAQNDIYSVIVDMDDAALAAWLAEHRFGAEAASYEPFPRRGGVVRGVRLTQYEVGELASWAHDMAIEPATGAAWVGDYILDELIRVDPRTGAQRSFRVPVKVSGMHTLHFDREGHMWITMQLSDMVARFDPATGAFRIYGGLAKGSLVHSFAYDSYGYVEFDDEGRLWLSQFGGNRISSLHPETGEIREYPLAGTADGRAYGIALDGSGRAWYTKYSQNVVGHVDPATGKAEEFELPRPDSGPHRMHIDDDDNLWIPLSGYGTLLRYDVDTGEMREYALPDADTFPYASRYDGKHGRVWITGNGANSLYVFDPQTERFATFRMPAALAYGRMVSIDYASGDVWTALSSYPNKHAGRDHGLLVRLHGALDTWPQEPARAAVAGGQP